MKAILEKGHSHLDIEIADDRVLEVLLGKDVPPMSHDYIREVISNGIKAHSPPDIRQKTIALIIPDDTRLWARGDLFVPEIAKTLLSMGVPAQNITIIIALGTHRDMKKKDFSALAGAFCAQNIRIINSAGKNQDRLVCMGETHRGTPLFFTREALEADHIIIFGGILHHLIAGFGGGPKYILPGIAGYDSIQANHSLAVQKDGTPHPRVRQASLPGNPVHEDITEAARIFLANKTSTCVAVAVNGSGDIFYSAAGPLHEVFVKGCAALNEACAVPIKEKGDFALISAGGHRTDTQFYQATKALFNVVGAVREGGEIVFVAGCSEGIGNTRFGEVLQTGRDRHEALGKELAVSFDMPSYVAYRTLDLLRRFKITLVSDFSQSETESLGFLFAKDIHHQIREMKGKGYIVPFAENILPLLRE